MNAFKKEMELAKYKQLLKINSKALENVTSEEQCQEDYDMSISELKDVIYYLLEKITELQPVRTSATTARQIATREADKMFEEDIIRDMFDGIDGIEDEWIDRGY